MAAYGAGIKTAAAAAATFSGASAAYVGLWSGASGIAYLRQIEVINTTTTDCEIALVRYTTRGTQSTTQAGVAFNSNAPTGLVAVDSAWSPNPTIGAATTIIKRTWLPASKGGGIIWVFPADRLPFGASQGYLLINPLGTGQVLETNFEWDE